MFSNRLYILLFPLCAMLLLASCKETISHNGKVPLVGVENEFLYKEDVDQLFATNRPQMDSVTFVKEYIQHWLEDVLLYKMAQRNIPDSKDVEALVDSYRKSLLLNIYQEKLVEQQLKREVTDTEIAEFYEYHKEMFLLDEPILQGLFLKVSKNAPRLAQVRKWYKSNKVDDIENLEKYSLTNAIVYEYFMDSWQSLSSLAAKMPITADELLSRLKKDDTIEFSDSAYYYFINSSLLLRKGELKPLDLASVEIEELLVNTLKANFMNEVKNNLFEEAMASGQVKFYDESSSKQLQAKMSEQN